MRPAFYDGGTWHGTGSTGQARPMHSPPSHSETGPTGFGPFSFDTVGV